MNFDSFGLLTFILLFTTFKKVFKIKNNIMKLTAFISVMFFIILCNKGNCVTNTQDSITVEEESDWYFGADAAFTDKYLWRGIIYNHGLILQPQVYAGYKDFSIYVWGNAPLWDVNDVAGNEIDVYLDYYHSFSFIDVEASLNMYSYPGQEYPTTLELFAGVFYPIGDFTVFADINVDLLANAGATFYELGLEYQKDLSKRFSIAAKALGGIGSKKFNSYNLDLEKSALNFIGGNIGLTYSICDGLFLDAGYYHNFIIDDEIKQAIRDIYDVPSSAFELKIRKEF